MSPTNVLDITREALLLMLWTTLPVVIVSAVVSLGVAVLQAVTQIQDQSIGQSARILAVLGTIVLAGAWLATGVLRFAERSLQTLGYLG